MVESSKVKEHPQETIIKKLLGLINCTIKGNSGEIIVTRVAAPCVLDVWIELNQIKIKVKTSLKTLEEKRTPPKVNTLTDREPM